MLKSHQLRCFWLTLLLRQCGQNSSRDQRNLTRTISVSSALVLRDYLALSSLSSHPSGRSLHCCSRQKILSISARSCSKISLSILIELVHRHRRTRLALDLGWKDHFRLGLCAQWKWESIWSWIQILEVEEKMTRSFYCESSEQWRRWNVCETLERLTFDGQRIEEELFTCQRSATSMESVALNLVSFL